MRLANKNSIPSAFVRRGSGAPAQISAPATLTPTVISATEIDLAWSAVVGATNYILEMATVSDYSDAVQIYSGALTVFNNTGLTGNTIYYYRVKAQAVGFTDSAWTSASATTNASISINNLTFTSNTGLVNTSQVFTSPGGGTGLDVINIPAGGAARIYCQYKADSQLAIMGFNTANAQVDYTGMENGFYLQGAALKNIANAGDVNDVQYTMTVNEWVGMICVNGVMKLQVSNDAITWTDIHTYRGYYYFTYPVQLYVVSFFAAGGKMYTPKIDVYGAGTFAKLFIQDGNSLGFGETGGAQSQVSIGQEVFFSLDTANDYLFGLTAITGRTTQQNITLLPTVVYPLFANAYSKIIVAVIEGTNQMYTGGSTPLQAYNLMMQYVNAVLNQDPRTCVMVYTMISINAALVPDADKIAYNNLLLATPQTSRFKIVDTTGTPALNDANAYLNGTYYLADGIHLTSTVGGGYKLLGNLGKPVAASF